MNANALRAILEHLTVLIDTWWNVNNYEDAENLLEKIVLIDTWWNVNILNFANGCVSSIVLIDTWWNVNNVINKSFSVITTF